MSHAENFMREAAQIAGNIDSELIDILASELVALRGRHGRLFIIGVGGSAANCTHAVNDFRKLCGIEAYSPLDNVAELTARTNDEGWETVFCEWLKVSRANKNDAILVFSVGGGDVEKNISVNIVRALDEAVSRDMKIFGIVGRDGGYTAKIGDVVIIIPTVANDRITPHSEAYQAVVWHCLSCHPELILHSNKWEGIANNFEQKSDPLVVGKV
jgi:D-sedoheptulose 7-phosphate isomerase